MEMIQQSTGSAVRLRVSSSPRDDAWDAFLFSQPHGHYMQSSLWARIKSAHGWGVLRLLAERDGRILGGAQLLTRSIARLPIRVGYVAKGPVTATGQPEIGHALLDAVESMARRRGIWMLRVQPPPEPPAAVEWLKARGFSRSRVRIASESTLVHDLGRPEDELLAGIPASTRRNFRRALKRGVTLRVGSRVDLPDFHRLLTGTARRRGFVVYGLPQFLTMWDVLAPGGHIRLLLADCDGQPEAGLLMFAFGDTAYTKFSANTAEARLRKAPTLLEWEALRWANANGFQGVDHETIDRGVAERLLNGEPLPPEDTPGLGTTFFKLSFGGRPVCMPGCLQKGYAFFAPRAAIEALTVFSRFKPMLSWVRGGPGRPSAPET